MTQYPHPYPPAAGVRETNALGIAGFVCSLVGLIVTGGILCPIGLILSLIALGRAPRGFAVAGLIIGLIGSCGWVLVFLLVPGLILAALGLAVVAVALTETEKLEITGDMANMAVAIKSYEGENDYLPADLDVLDLKESTRHDPWGRRYQYHLQDESPGFDIVSAGEDGRFGTDDDVKFTALGEAWQAGGIGVKVEEDDGTGRVRIKLGDRTLTAEGDDDRGHVTIDLGDRVIEIVGDETGGHFNVKPAGGEEDEETGEGEDGDGAEQARVGVDDAAGLGEGDGPVRPIERFVTEFHTHFTRHPNACVRLGVDRRLDELPDPSLDETSRCVQEARELLGALARVDTERLAFDERLDLDLARLMLEAEIHRETCTSDGRTRREQMPWGGEEIGDPIHTMLLVDPRPAGDRLADITARIEFVPAYLAALLERLDHPVDRWIDIEVDEVGAVPQLLSTVRLWAEREAWPDTDRLGRAVEAAEIAIDRYVEGLRALPTNDVFHIGRDQTRRLVALMGIDLSLETLHETARRFLLSTGAVIDDLRSTLARRYDLGPDASAETVQSVLDERYALRTPDAEGVLRRYEVERERVVAFVTEHDLFPIPDDQAMRIVQTPEFMVPSIPAGAMNAPAPFREGIRTSQIYLTLTDDRRAEHTELSIPGMMIHEGIPGHHLQLAIASKHPSVIRRHVSASDHAEGWTTMLEDYMLDLGYMGPLEDEARFLAKRGIARLGARVVIDLFFMTGDRSFLDVGIEGLDLGDDPFEAAGRLLTAVTGFSPARVQGELNWYSRERGIPLTYLAGNHLVWALKRDVTAAASRLGAPTGRDLDRRFHRIYLESGNMPVRYLRRVFDEQGLL